MKCKDIIKALEELAPVKYAEEWDNVGLLAGNKEKEVKRVMIALDATEDVIGQAIIKQVDMLITHHPMIFSSMKRITYDNFIGKKIIKLIQNDISYYAMHTNFDVMVMAEAGAKKLNIFRTRILDPTYYEKRYKIVVFVPTDSGEKVREAMTKEGAGHVGTYSNCTFHTQGMGTYMPLEGTNPYIGTVNELSFTPEYRLETIVTEEIRDKVITAMLRVHPYEEVAYDVYELHRETADQGVGKYGYLEEDKTLGELAQIVKEKFGLDQVKVSGDLEQKAGLVAVSPGAGKSLVKAAIKVGAQVLVTGDIDHHTAIDGLEQGLSIIDGGHFGTEHLMVDYVKDYLEVYFNRQYDEIWDMNKHIEIITAKEKSPFCYV